MDLEFDLHHHYRYNEAAHITPNSEIYRAMDLRLNRNVAIKKVRIEGSTPQERQANLKQAMQEVKAMVAINELTPRIPVIYDCHYAEKTGDLFIIMQWIDGMNLARRAALGVSPAQFLQWMAQLCDILDIMAKKHFYHKDIKPENIMFSGPREDLYLIDFNISVSLPNTLEGTPDYKAPEMDFDSTCVTRDKSDMFSVGVMMYQCFTGTLPRRGEHYDIYSSDSKSWDLFVQPKELAPGIPDKLNSIIVQCMSLDPRDRFRSYRDLSRELRNAGRSLRNGR